MWKVTEGKGAAFWSIPSSDYHLHQEGRSFKVNEVYPDRQYHVRYTKYTPVGTVMQSVRSVLLVGIVM